MLKNRNLILALFIGISTVPCLWAGKEFTAGPNDTIVPNQLIVKLQSGASINQVLAPIVPQALVSLISSRLNSYLLQLPPGIQSVISKALAALPLVDYVEPNRIRKVNIVGAPNDPNYASQWALTNIQALQAWNYLPDQYLTAATAGTNRVKVAVLDTGADCTHPDFKNLGGTSADSALGGQLLFASSQALVATTVPSPTCAWQDDHGHGTHTAGTIGAATQNGIGVASVGYPLQVIVYKVLDSAGNGSDNVIAQAIENAANAGAQVVSMSLGGTGYSQTLQSAIDYAWQHNTLVVSAAGNTGGSDLVYPGAANHGLGVAATDTDNSRASFSTFGNWTKIAAPGVNVLSTAPTYSTPLGVLNYAYLSGTSMATPHVAAVAGLVYMANPNLSVAAVAQRLQQAAQTPNAGWDQYIGYGVLNAAGAVSGTLRPATFGSLVGQVVDGSNLPVTGVTVSTNGQSFTTASDGLFRIPNLTAATYILTATGGGFGAVTMQAAVLSGADTMLTVRMGVATGEFTGTVTSNGSPVAGASVEGVSGGLIVGTAVTDANGSYALYLTPGTYNVTASAPGDINTTVSSQTLSGGATKTVNIAISRLGNITGAVKDSAGTPVPLAHIDIMSTTFSAGTTADSSGNFATFGIPSGTYSVTASSPGFTNITLTGVTVNANLSTPVTLQFSTTYSPLPVGLVGYWTFDEGSGVVAHDTSGSGYNGNVNGASWITGRINSALNFNGSTNSVITSNIALGQTFSISAWVNPSVIPEGAYVRIAETQFGSGFFLGTNSTGGKYKFIVNANVPSGSSGSCPYGCAEGGTVTSGWHLVSATFDGSSAKLYVDSALVGSDTLSAPFNTNLPLYLGAYYGGGGYGWNGGIDDVRLYNRALTASDVSAIFSYSGGPQDTTPPSIPGNVSATAVSASQINVSWSASTDNVGVTGYRVYRNGSSVGTATTLSFPDSGLVASTTYSYTVAAFDAAGNVSNQSLTAMATTLSAGDTTPPAVSITAPIANATVSSVITVTATASDNVAVADVQFQLDGVSLGADLTSPPYSISWDTTTASNGTHNLTAVARDTSHNATTSTIVTVTVSNAVTGPPTTGLIGYWNFDENSGAIAHDTSGGGHNGAINGATWTVGKINSALNFNGSTNDVVTPSISLGVTFSITAWVNTGGAAEGAYVRIAETQFGAGFYLGTNSSGTRYKFIVNANVPAGSAGSCAYGCAEGGTVTSGWHLVTATFDGSSAKLYVDSALVGSDTLPAPFNTNLPLYIGQYYGGSGYGWNGAIDEVRLYNRALTAPEVTSIYNFGGSSDSTPPAVSITTPLANTTVSNTVTVTATASDNVAVADVQFQLDGVNLGADLTSSPYSISWDTTTAGNGSHTLTAIARDTSHNMATSLAVPVTVSNTTSGLPTAGLIGYWNFDEDSGIVAHDTSGSGYNAAVNGATWTTGKVNFGLNFNGTTNDVVTPNIALGATFTVSAWVNAVATEGGYVRIAETHFESGFYLGTNSSGTRYKFIVNANVPNGNGACAYGCAEGGTVSSGWHLVTATFDGTTAKLYVDNALVGSDTFNAPFNTNLPLFIGQYYGGGYGWNGGIDEVRLYNRALTATEVSAIFNH